MDTQDSKTEQLEPASRNSSTGGTVSISRVFLTTELTQRLDLVRHLIANSDRIPLLRGIPGIGKSTLLGVLEQQAPANWDVHCIHATPMLQRDQLIHELCRRFSIQQEYPEEVEQLVQKLVDLRQMDLLPVIIVDDAEQLPVSTLMELFSIFSKVFGQEGRLAVVLFASPLIDDLLEETRLQFASQRLQVLELRPFHREQSDHFVRHLFMVLAGQQELSVSEERYEKIYRASGGLPGKIIQQVEKMLQPETITPVVLAKKKFFLPQLLSDVSAPVLVGSGILALLLLLTLIYENEINAVFESDGSELVEASVETIEGRRMVPLTLPDQSMKVERDVPASVETEKVSIVELPGVAGESDETTAKPDSPSQLLNEDKSEPPAVVVVTLPHLATLQPTTDIVESGESIQQTEQPTIPPISAASETKKTMNNVPLAKTLEAPPAIIKEEAIAAEVVPTEVTAPLTLPVPEKKAETLESPPAPVTELGQARKLERKIVPEPISLTNKVEKTSPATVLESGIRRETWLLNQAPDSYTLQLIGLGDEQAVTSFIRRHKLEGNAAYFRTKSNGRPWFPVLYGLYPSRSAAVAARSKLPGDLAKQGSWPRSLASIQQAIRGE